MTHLSDVFKYISYYRHAGHQVGRKIGDMLEVLTYAAIAQDCELKSRLHVEPKFFGFTDAGHKVEFVLHYHEETDCHGLPRVRKGGEILDPSDIISFIECKKVGVEQTINGKFKRVFTKTRDSKYYIMPFNSEYEITFAPRGQDKHTYTITINSDKTISVSKEEDASFSFCDTIADNYRLIFALGCDSDSMVIGNDSSLRDFDGLLQKCKILDIAKVERDHITAILNDCLAGPQTPEKAKQASFVALDIRKKRFDSFDKRVPEEDMISVLVLTEFSHWEEKSRKMVCACIDKILVVDDAIIIEAMDQFNASFGNAFYDMISKDRFETNDQVRDIALNIVRKYEGRIFYDIDEEEYKKFAIVNSLFKLV